MLKSIRIKNFKAIRDSKVIRLTPLTVFIGNNGSGKSSVIEALETYKNIVQSALHTTKKGSIKFHSTVFNLSWQKYSATMSINSTPNLEQIFVEQEKISTFNKDSATRSDRTVVYVVPSNLTLPTKMLVPDDESIVSTFCDNQLHINLYSDINRWQFLNYNPNTTEIYTLSLHYALPTSVPTP